MQALLQEIDERVPATDIATIYFGGGTPSLLETEQIAQLLQALLNKTTTEPTEITLEANPGDLTPDKLQALRQIGINRLSIGIQSFDDEQLRFLGRRHNAEQARQAVRDAQAAGFDNISIDLIYALPGETMTTWHRDIDEALNRNVQHISCYCLSYEPGTPLTKLLESGQVTQIDEEVENAMFDELCSQLQEHGFEHYEVSNFALPGFRARHNSSYWNDTPYIGLGAGAHSYDGQVRRWNIANLAAYVKRVLSHSTYWEEEVLTDEQKAIEHIMLGLRTRDGIALTAELRAKAQHLIADGLLQEENGQLIATPSGLHILNRIIEQLI